MVGSSVGYLLENRPDDGVKWGHWNHMQLTSGWIYQKVSVDL